MTFTIFDIAIFIVLVGFVFYGFFFGLIRTLGSLLGLVAGAWVAITFYEPVSAYINKVFFGYNTIGKTIVFFIIFILVKWLVSFLFSLLDRGLDFVSVVPLLKSINRLAGAILGLLEGGLALGIIFYLMMKYPITTIAYKKISDGSIIIPYILGFTKDFWPFIPAAINKVSKYIIK